jgi:hypothetical protein
VLLASCWITSRQHLRTTAPGMPSPPRPFTVNSAVLRHPPIFSSSVYKRRHRGSRAPLFPAFRNPDVAASREDPVRIWCGRASSPPGWGSPLCHEDAVFSLRFIASVRSCARAAPGSHDRGAGANCCAAAMRHRRVQWMMDLGLLGCCCPEAYAWSRRWGRRPGRFRALPAGERSLGWPRPASFPANGVARRHSLLPASFPAALRRRALERRRRPARRSAQLVAEDRGTPFVASFARFVLLEKRQVTHAVLHALHDFSTACACRAGKPRDRVALRAHVPSSMDARFLFAKAAGRGDRARREVPVEWAGGDSPPAVRHYAR